MLIKEFDEYIRSFLPFAEMAKADSALNGLQVGRENQEVTKIAFAVDASMATFKQAKQEKADLLFVHHGLFWGFDRPVIGNIRSRLKYLFDHDIALYAVHLPLDVAPVVGNNAGIADALELTQQEPFGIYHGVKIGIKGRLAASASLEEISSMLFGNTGIHPGTLPFGKDQVSTIGIVSGGAAMNAFDAINDGLDLYITGESSHTVYHECLEAGLSVIFGGHYRTEVYGVQAITEKCRADQKLETVFIDIPTGL
ncbi:MAG: Nif3-like dinuclear metal center hexameric protein [Spirochaetales bacterium]|nr:Nif3-like dinuclear metal center hexameric protein [Spirochaetales bacterium]